MNPKVTILLATFNRAHLIEETLKSIQNQTYKNFECLITDDNSADNTKQIVETFSTQDSRFKYFKKTSKYEAGLSETRNFGLDLAAERNAKYIQFFDDDDIMHPEKIELQIKSLIENNFDLVLCGSKNFEDTYEFTSDKFIRPEIKALPDQYLKGDLHFGAPIPLFKFSYINQLRFNKNLFYAEEWELFVRLFYTSPPKIDYVERTLFYRRKHPESITSSLDEDFKKRKTSAVTGIILFDFLTEKNLHSRVSLIHFTKHFSFKTYDRKRLYKIQNILGNKNVSKFISVKIKFIIFLHRFLYRFATWFLS